MGDWQEVTGVSILPVKANQRQQFEAFCRDVVAPAVRSQRPTLVGRWLLLRPSEHNETIASYSLLFAGGEPDDWDLNSLLTAEYGETEGERLLSQWDAFHAEEQIDYDFRDAVTY